ncbi:ATP-binding cassette domain-containing protein [Evansella halocellulosilytica]|uniref:ATP-binding cassette domain-containing protein n=1 Tax=Evansella halocellulosilytica TaxID=2011013 RepID=UPI000BB9A902|nr:ABC transporter ATP-binding protein [Evansella halocellulosilytica]
MKIELKNVSKTILGQPVLKGFSWSIDEPGIYAVLGPNGAGKTTMMQIMSGLSIHDSGEVHVNGENPFNNRKTLSEISFVQESDNFKPTLTIEQVISIVQPFYPNWNHSLANTLIDTFNLPRKKRLNQLSKGMGSALHMIIGLASRAPLTIFDEPYIGMDARARKTVYQAILDDYLEYPRVILFSTHFIEETENLFQSVCIIEQGSKTFESNIDQLSERALQITGPKEVVYSLAKEASTVLSTSTFMSEASMNVLLNEGEVLNIPHTCKQKSISLQDLFIDFTSHSKEGEHV